MKRLRAALVWLSPTLLALLWLQRGILSGELFFKRDTLLVFLPLKRYLADALSKGQLAEWWPFDALGQPLTSLPIASAFHPTTVLYALFPFAFAFALQTLLPMIVLPLGAWRLARTLGLRGAGAGLVAVVSGISFWNVLLAEQTQMHLAAASLPWLWREAIRLHRSRRGSLLVLSLSVANVVVGGDPMLLELAVICLVPLLWRWPLRPRALGRVALGGVLGVGLGAVQLAPMVFAFLDSPRSAGLGLTVDDYWALRFPQLAGAVLPVHHGTDYLFDTLYVGLPVIALAVAGLFTPWRARYRLLAVLLILVVTAFGRAAPLWHVFNAVLPGWRGFQYPVKALGPALLPLALLAGRGLTSPRRLWALLAGALGGAGLLALGVMSAGLQIIAGLLGWLRERQPAMAQQLSWALLLTLAIDLGWHLGAAPTRPWELTETPPDLALALQRAGVSTTGGSYEWSYTVPESMDSRMPHWRELQTEFQLLTMAPDTGALFGLPTSRAYLAGVTRPVFELRQSQQWSALLPRFGVTARVVTFQGAEPPTGNLFADRDVGVALLPVDAPFPRAYVAFSTLETPTQQQVPALLSLQDDAVMVEPGAGLSGGGVARPRQPVTLKREVDSLSAELDLDAPGVLVINEAFARGWSAHDGDREVPIIAANHAVMGVSLTPGHHQVLFEYETPGLRIGLGITFATLVLVLVLGVRLRRR